MKPFDYSKAADASQAISLCEGNRRASFIAGGTNLIDLMKENIAAPDRLIDINPIDAWKDIEELPDGGLRLGALARNAETAYHPLVRNRYPLLSKAILAGASPQLRNMASNGGNLLQRTRCYYFYDIAMPCNKRQPGSGCPALEGYNRIHAILGASESCIAVYPSDMSVALAALEATVNINGSNGDRALPFSDFHRLPGNTPETDNNLEPSELISAIDLPADGFSKNYAYLKLRDRTSYAFALVSVASAFDIEDGVIRKARIALGGVAHKPWRNIDAENLLTGKPPTAAAFAAAADVILDEARGLQHNRFKIELARRAIVRNGLAAAQLIDNGHGNGK